MIKTVLDTNTIVSGTIESRGIPCSLLEAAREQRFVLVTSAVIVEEVVRVLSRERIRRKYGVTPDEVDRVRTLLERESLLSPITTSVHGVASHPEDDLILATAVSAGADYLVTGDRELLKLTVFGNVAIVNPREFASRLSLL